MLSLATSVISYMLVLHKKTSYKFLLCLLEDLGLQISANNLFPPSTTMICLGILIDTLKKTISILQDKLSEIQTTCKSWNYKTVCTKNQSQSFTGSLHYIT